MNRYPLVIYIYFEGIQTVPVFYSHEHLEFYSMNVFKCHESIQVFDWGDTFK
jgi:hypothetical protein